MKVTLHTSESSVIFATHIPSPAEAQKISPEDPIKQYIQTISDFSRDYPSYDTTAINKITPPPTEEQITNFLTLSSIFQPIYLTGFTRSKLYNLLSQNILVPMTPPETNSSSSNSDVEGNVQLSEYPPFANPPLNSTYGTELTINLPASASVYAEFSIIQARKVTHPLPQKTQNQASE